MTKRTIYQLPDETQRSFLAAYELSAMTIFDRDRVRHLAEQQPDRAAFEDGIELRDAMIGVYSADTRRELDEYTSRYDVLAMELNAKYGDIVLTSDEARGGDLGLRGYRIPQFSSVETGVRGPDGTFEVTVEDLAEKVAAEDLQVRRELERPDE